jgi:hypothetical protein
MNGALSVRYDYIYQCWKCVPIIFMSKTCDIENQKEDENHLEEIKKDNIEAARKQRSKFKATVTEETNSDQK